MKIYSPATFVSLRPGCGCCVPNKSGHGHKSKRKTASADSAKRNAKKAARQAGKKDCFDVE